MEDVTFSRDTETGLQMEEVFLTTKASRRTGVPHLLLFWEAGQVLNSDYYSEPPEHMSQELKETRFLGENVREDAQAWGSRGLLPGIQRGGALEAEPGWFSDTRENRNKQQIYMSFDRKFLPSSTSPKLRFQLHLNDRH